MALVTRWEPAGPAASSTPCSGQVVGLGAAAGEDDLAGLGPQQAGHLDPRPVDGLAGLPPLDVETGRVAPKLVEVRPHGLQHRGSGAVVAALSK